MPPRRRKPPSRAAYKDLDHHKHTRVTSRVNMWLIIMALVLCAFETGLFFGAPVAKREEILVLAALRYVWVLALIFALWYKQRWARYMLRGMLLLSIVLNVTAMSFYFGWTSVGTVIAAAMCIANAGFFIVLSNDDFRDYMSIRD